jgi:hypothetical protein
MELASIKALACSNPASAIKNASRTSLKFWDRLNSSEVNCMATGIRLKITTMRSRAIMSATPDSFRRGGGRKTLLRGRQVVLFWVIIILYSLTCYWVRALFSVIGYIAIAAPKMNNY